MGGGGGDSVADACVKPLEASSIRKLNTDHQPSLIGCCEKSCEVNDISFWTFDFFDLPSKGKDLVCFKAYVHYGKLS